MSVIACRHGGGNLGPDDCTICRDARNAMLRAKGDAAKAALFAFEEALTSTGDPAGEHYRRRVYALRVEVGYITHDAMRSHQ